MNTKHELFRYTGCGLDNVFLLDGYRMSTLQSGASVVVIDDLPGLHTAIAMAIVSSPAPLDAKTFKFLRKEQDCSQRQLASLLGVDEQTVSLWERARQPIPKYADILLRTWAKERCSNNAELIRTMEQMNALDRDIRSLEEDIEMTQQDGHWTTLKAA